MLGASTISKAARNTHESRFTVRYDTITNYTSIALRQNRTLATTKGKVL